MRRQAVSTSSRRAYGRSRQKESTRPRWAKTWGGTASSGLANLDFHSSRNGAPDRIGDGGVGIAPLHDRPQALRRHPGGPYPDVRPGTERTGRNGVVHTHQAAIVGLAVSTVTSRVVSATASWAARSAIMVALQAACAARRSHPGEGALAPPPRVCGMSVTTDHPPGPCTRMRNPAPQPPAPVCPESAHRRDGRPGAALRLPRQSEWYSRPSPLPPHVGAANGGHVDRAKIGWCGRGDSNPHGVSPTGF